MNENVLEARGGAKDVPIVVDMTRQRFGGGLSGFVPTGYYAIEGVNAEVTDQVGDKTGKNFHVTWETVGPEGEHTGVRLECYHPIPIGDPSSTEYQKRERNLQDMIASHFSGLGQLDEIRGKRDAKLTPAFVLGNDAQGSKRRFFVLTKERDYKGQAVAEVAFYVDAKEYADRPGPMKGAPRPAAGGAAATGSTGTPDLMGGSSPEASSEASSGGNGSPAVAGGGGKSAVDDALGI